MDTAQDVSRALMAYGTPERAAASGWFFKTGPGQYGEGDVFIGVTVPEQRTIAKEYENLPLKEIEMLLEDRRHECRATAIFILTRQFAKADKKTQAKIVRFYMKHFSRVNNWDLVDSSARPILGTWLLSQPEKERAILYKLATSKKLWERRVSIVATHAFIVEEEFKDTFAIADILLSDTEDLMHKAVGWMLREVGKRSTKDLESYLKKNAAIMPRTALRYALEHFPDSVRKEYMGMKKRAS